jgi:hypothetical protein
MKSKKGKRRTVWLSNRLDNKAEEIRQKLGLGRSGFYRYAVVEVIKQFATTPAGETPKK